MQPMGHKSAGSGLGLNNHPHPVQGSNPSGHSLAAGSGHFYTL